MIKVSEPNIGKLEESSVIRSLRSGMISSFGPAVEEFEKKWAKFCNRKYGVSVANGTVALQLALKILNLKKDDEIIMPSNTIISCAMAAVYNDLKIIPIDCRIDNWCIDEDLIEDKITKKTKAILIVNIFGHPCNMDKIIKISKKYKLYIIEDAAESHGSKYKNKMCGSFGDISTFSFYANKLITTGEGGMLLMNNKKLYEAARYYRNLCFNEKDRFNHKHLGFNFRFTNIQAEIGLAQIKRIKKFIRKKILIAKFYNKSFKDNINIQIVKNEKWAFNTYWMYGIVIKNKIITAKNFIKKLKKKNIEARPFFYGLHMQNVLKKIVKKNSKCTNTEYISKYGFYIPSGLNINKKELNTVSTAVNNLINNI